MLFRFRRYSRVRLLGILAIVSGVFITHFLIYRLSDLDFLELQACPACFGVQLCHLFETKDVHLSGWQRWSFLNNDFFNIKNIFYGTLHKRPVVLKKMAHPSEWIAFDSCKQKKSCPDQMTSSLSTLLPCSNRTFISQFQNAFVISTTFAATADSEIALATTIQINLEPIVLSGLSDSGLPIPSYYGACGRVTVVSDEGSNLVTYLRSSFPVRAFLARELLISMHQLITAHADLVVYYPDINLENFVYNERKKRVKIIDLEYVILVERRLYSNIDDRNVNQDTIVGSERFCQTYMADYNIEQVCRYILSSSKVSSNLLHSIPRTIDTAWNLTDVIQRCVRTQSRQERLDLYEELLTILDNILK